jgi:hypothetical protein
MVAMEPTEEKRLMNHPEADICAKQTYMFETGRDPVIVKSLSLSLLPLNSDLDS